MSNSSQPHRSRSAVPPIAQRARAAMKSKLPFLSAPKAVLVSAALHTIAALLALTLKSGATIEGAEVQFTLDTVRDEQTELQVFSSVLVEPPLGATAVLLDDGVSDTPPIGIPEGVATTDALVASLLRPSSETQAGNETVRGDRRNEMNELQMTYAMDASCYDEKIAWIDTAHTEVDGPHRSLSSVVAVQGGDHLTVIADDFMSLSPGRIPSLVFIPLGDPNEVMKHAHEMSEMRRDVLEWVVAKVLATPPSYTVRTSSQLIIIAHDAPLSHDKLRRIVMRWADQVPMVVVCVKSQSSHGDLFQRIATDSGGACFGIK